MYDGTPCTRRRQMHAYTCTVYMSSYVTKLSVLGRTAWVLQFVYIIPAITQTIATV